MTTPKRIQRKRTKGWRMPEGAVYVGRGSCYGNPFRAYEHCKGEDWGVMDTGRLHSPMGHGWTKVGAINFAIRAYEGVLKDIYRPNSSAEYALIQTLKGKDLVCWCPPDRPCHADVLLEIANGGTA